MRLSRPLNFSMNSLCGELWVLTQGFPREDGIRCLVALTVISIPSLWSGRAIAPAQASDRYLMADPLRHEGSA